MLSEKIQGYLTVKDAAQQLGVGEHRIRALIRSGDIAAVKPSSRATLIDAVSFQIYQQIAHQSGRPYEQRIALGVLWSLSGIEPYWLDYHQKRRCAIALQHADASSIVSKCRRRARTMRMRIVEPFLDEAAGHLLLSGISVARRYALDIADSANMLEGYADDVGYMALKEACFGVDDPYGNVVVHRADFLPEPHWGAMPVAVAAVDLASSMETRSRAVGSSKLEELLDAREYADHR